MTDDIGATRSVRVALGVLAAVFALLVADLVADSGRGASLPHLAVEVGAALLAGGGIVGLLARLHALAAEQRSLHLRLTASEEEAARWRAEAAGLADGFRSALERQFDHWRLSPAEREVALLLLRGLSHKQIAGRRDASERTVRQQAHLLYRKAGFASRADLAAFFLAGLVGGAERDESPARDRPPGGGSQ